MLAMSYSLCVSKYRKEPDQKWAKMLCVILQLCFKLGNEIEHL